MDPIWHYMAALLASARLTRSDRTLSILSWKLVAFGVAVAALFAGGAHLLGWRVRDPGTSAQVTLPRTVAPFRNDGRSIAVRAEASAAKCHASLNEAGVSFKTLRDDQAPGVDWPILLTSAVGGVRIQGGRKDAPTNYLDCRLALALLAWAPSLREHGIVGLQHLSLYRRDAVIAASSKQSGHALGMAIDVARFELRDGRELSVLDDWVNRDRGADPCREWPTDADAGRLMRKLVCDAYERDLFQSVVTPHANDAHANHVHLEIRRTSEGTWLD